MLEGRLGSQSNLASTQIHFLLAGPRQIVVSQWIRVGEVVEEGQLRSKRQAGEGEPGSPAVVV